MSKDSGKSSSPLAWTLIVAGLLLFWFFVCSSTGFGQWLVGTLRYVFSF